MIFKTTATYVRVYGMINWHFTDRKTRRIEITALNSGFSI